MSYKQWRNHIRNILRMYQAGESKSMFYWYLKNQTQPNFLKQKFGNISLVNFEKYSWQELWQIYNVYL